MKAIHLSVQDLNVGRVLEIRGEKYHHLVNVTRLTAGENVLILRGDGLVAKSEAVQIERRRLHLEVYDVSIVEDKRFLDLAVGVTKKESFEESLKIACECGVRRVYPFFSDFAQRFELNNKRIERIIESALIQSNNPFSLEMGHLIESLETLGSLIENYEESFFANSRAEHGEASEKKRREGRGSLLIVGPEGGFSQNEQKYLSKTCTDTVSLPSYILRTPHAVAACFGWISRGEN